MASEGNYEGNSKTIIRRSTVVYNETAQAEIARNEQERYICLIVSLLCFMFFCLSNSITESERSG
jgi:hypothetical protein